MFRFVASGLLTCLLLLITSGELLAQERTVTGTITDSMSEEPLPGVNVVIQGTQRGTTSGPDGGYSIEVRGPDDVLVASFVGFERQEQVVGDREVIDFALVEDVAMLEDLVVVGYGERRRGDVTGSVASVDVGTANVGRITNPDQMIQGRVAGVNITPSDGGPGAGSVFRIRGGTSIGASNEPLFVIDGVPVDNAQNEPGGAGVSGQPNRNPLNMINPNDIASIDILKDASAAAIYGSRGANGVVLITTKQGEAGSISIDYDGNVSAATLARRVDLLSASEYRSFVEDLVAQGDASQGRLDAMGDANTDWQDAITRTAVSHNHNLALSGGTEETQYRASVSYLDEQGIVLSSGLERVTARINANHRAFDGRLRTGLNLTSGYIRDDNLPYQQTGGFEGGLFTNVFKFNPTYPVRADQGGYYEYPGTSVRNPVALAEQISDFTNTTRTIGNIFGELDLLPGLSTRVNVGLNRQQASRRMYFPRANPVGRATGGEAIQRNRERSSILLENTVTYRGALVEGHAIEATGGYSWQEFQVEELGATMRDFITDAWLYNNLGGGEDDSVIPYSFKEENRLVSFFGRVNYDLYDRYLLTATLRQDGSTRFGAENKWGLFPSFSAAWRLSDETFMGGVEWLSNLMLRAGFGITGSQEIGNYRSLATLAPDPGFRAIFDGQEIVGVGPNNFPNPDLGWEETRAYNIGVDYSLMRGRIQGSVELYRKDTEDLLLDISVPDPAPVATRLENVGSMRNQGFEFSIDARAIDRDDRFLTVGANFNTNHNEVTSLGDRDEIITGTVSGAGQTGVQAQRIRPGDPIGTFYGPVFLGIENGEQQFLEDEDGNIIRQNIGNAQPDFTYGLNLQGGFRNWDFGVFLRGVQGTDVFNNTGLEYTLKDNVNTDINLLRPALDDGTTVSASAVYSSRWIEDGSFLRLDNMQVGYTLTDLPAVNQARVYLSGQNLFLITSYTGWDPEVNTDAGLATLGMDYTTYPRARTFTMGVSLSF